MRRLTAHQLRQRLQRRGYTNEEIEQTIERATFERLLDDRLYAQLSVGYRTKPLGDRRLIGDLLTKGIDPVLARETVAMMEQSESERLASAYETLLRRRPGLTPPTIARALARQGFTTPAIYRLLRERSVSFFQGEECRLNEE